MFSKEERLRALQMYDECGSVEEAIRRLGYPTRRCLYNWIEQRKGRKYSPYPSPAPPKEPKHSRGWVIPSRASGQEEKPKLLKQLRQMQMMIDIFEKILQLREGDEDFLAGLSPQEATVIIDSLRDRYSLWELTETLGINRSAYHYQKSLSQNR